MSSPTVHVLGTLQIHMLMVFKDEPFGRLLGLGDIMNMGLHDGISGLIRKGRET
jgi:hypothetical protein